MNPLVGARIAAAAHHPERPALFAGPKTWTWSSLDAEVCGLQGVLHAHGVQPGDRVGVLSDRSAAAIIGIHAVLAAGAAVVPLDPSHPPARVVQIIEDAQLSAILAGSRTTRKHARTLRETTAPVVPLDSRGPPVEPVVAPPGADALILYTSGSTGRPKGVVLSGRAVDAFVRWAAGALDLSPFDRVAHLSPLSFDLCTLELFAPPLVGAATDVVAAGSTMFPASLARALAACTVVYTVPSVWCRLLEADLGALAEGPLRAVVYAGEPFAPAPLGRLMRALPGRPVHNFFGPTETNVCCAHRITRPPTGPVPIGHAASGARLHIEPEGSDLQQGELWIAGPSVMTGYHRQPARTRAAFTTSPDGTRWLRTGDRVRRDPTGRLHALGRRDTMLKHRGFRVQPEEVEAALVAFEGVSEARVSVDDTGGLRAEVVSDADCSARDLRRAVARRLPPYMVPTAFHRVAALPRTDRGKLDRAAPALPLRTAPPAR